MYCHLCHLEASPTHDSSSGHLAARELVAVAVDRLSNYVASEDSAEETPIVPVKDKTVKTPEAVGFCDSCNIVVPVSQHSSHLRIRKHALAFLSEQTFEELVHAYVGEDSKIEPTDPTDDGAFVDDTEAVDTYTCHLCDLLVPQVFKTEHERGSRHRTSRTLALAAARRARDTISARPDASGNGHKFTGKMMKKLLKAYRGSDEEKTDVKEAEPEPIKPEPERLTAKQYFTDILPYLPYVGSFYSLIIDNTQFVTVQIANETLKIHVNNFNGLQYFEGNGGYMNCRLCDGFNNACYGVVQDKLHVMSLGHIKNALSPLDSVHLIRKIGDTHSICGLCNMHIASHLVDNHILKDACHTMALSEALERGKEYKENKDNLKIRIFMPQSMKLSIFMKPNEFNNNNNRWPQPRHYSGTLFGSGQNTGLFGAQNTGFGGAQNTGFGGALNTGFASAQNTGFGSTQATGFGSNCNTGFASAQNTGFGSAPGFGEAKGSVFGAAKPSVFGAAQTQGLVAQQNTPAFGTAQNQGPSGLNNSAQTNQNATTFGGTRNNTCSFGSHQNSGTGFRATNKNALFGNTMNNTATFNVAEPARGNAPMNSGESLTSTVFGSTQNTGGLFGNAQNKDRLGVSPQKKAVNVPDQMNKSPESWSVWDQKNTAPDDWNNFKLVNSEGQLNRPVHVVKKQDSTPIGLHFANSGDSQNTFANAQPPITNAKISSWPSLGPKEKKSGDAQAQSKNEANAQINKPILTIQPLKPNYYSSTSSDSD